MPDRYTEKVRGHFDGAAQVYSQRRGIVHGEADPVILDMVHRRGPGRILELGGGSGSLLAMLGEVSPESQAYNCELAWQTYRRQASPGIRLIGGDALHLPFPDDTFDYLILKNVLHHLVGGSRGASVRNALTSVAELKRVAQRGAWLFMVEQFHRYRWCSEILFFLSLLFSIARIQIVSIGIRRDIIASFLTPDEIHRLFEPLTNETFLFDKQIPLRAPYPLRFLPFFRQFGRQFFAVEIQK
jgi:ubiquinone/menaquinone biosynthesis C-methylase UbiE